MLTDGGEGINRITRPLTREGIIVVADELLKEVRTTMSSGSRPRFHLTEDDQSADALEAATVQAVGGHMRLHFDATMASSVPTRGDTSALVDGHARSLSDRRESLVRGWVAGDLCARTYHVAQAELLIDTLRSVQRPPLLHESVRLVALSARPELNGARGEVVSFKASSGRYVVRLEPGGREQGADHLLTLKPSNLELEPDELDAFSDEEEEQADFDGVMEAAMRHEVLSEAQADALTDALASGRKTTAEITSGLVPRVRVARCATLSQASQSYVIQGVLADVQLAKARHALRCGAFTAPLLEAVARMLVRGLRACKAADALVEQSIDAAENLEEAQVMAASFARFDQEAGRKRAALTCELAGLACEESALSPERSLHLRQRYSGGVHVPTKEAAALLFQGRWWETREEQRRATLCGSGSGSEEEEFSGGFEAGAAHPMESWLLGVCPPAHADRAEGIIGFLIVMDVGKDSTFFGKVLVFTPFSSLDFGDEAGREVRQSAKPSASDIEPLLLQAMCGTSQTWEERVGHAMAGPPRRPHVIGITDESLGCMAKGSRKRLDTELLRPLGISLARAAGREWEHGCAMLAAAVPALKVAAFESPGELEQRRAEFHAER